MAEHTQEQKQEAVRDVTALPQATLANAKANKVPSGYKQTEVGWIPEDWDVCRIEQHAAISTGEKNTQDKIADGRYPFFVRSQNVERINSYSFEGEAVLTAGDGVGTGKIFHYINGRFDVHQRVYRISDFSLSMNGKYFFYQFSNRFYDRIMAMTAKSSVDSVRRDMIAGMSIPLPPLPEQRAIATALSEVDALIDALDRLIAKKRDIKQATMQQLLTGETRLPGFEGEWEKHQLGELGSFRKGQGIRKGEVQDEGLPCVRYGEIYTHHHDYVRKFYSFISAQVAQNSQQMKYGDLLFAGSGETAEEIGKCVAYLGDEEAYAGGDIVIFTPTGQDPRFLGFLLNHPYIVSQKSRMGQGDAVVHIHARHLAAIKLELPPIEEQQAIATVLSDMDAEIEALERRRKKTKQIKQGMMQELLTGRTRLVPSEAGLIKVADPEHPRAGYVPGWA